MRPVGKRTYILTICFCCLALTLSSCSKNEDQEDTGVQGLLNNVGLLPNANTPGKAPKYTVPTLDVLRGKLQQFPSEYPIAQYPNARMIVAEVRPDFTEARPNFVCLGTGDSLPQVAYYYKQLLTKDGWKPQQFEENTAYSSTIWTKGKLKAEVRVCPSPRHGEHIIQLLIYPAGRGLH